MVARRRTSARRAAPSEEGFNEFFISADEPIYTSGVVCKLLSIPIWILKQLDREGIVSPPRAKAGQSRLYSKRELKKLDKVWYLMHERSVKVDGVKVILEMETQGYVNYK